MIHGEIGAVSEALFLAGGGETGALIRAHDWAATPLGPPATWPSALKTAVGLMLGSAQPGYVAWGPELTSVYNDGYLPILGAKHPDGLGKPCAQLWAEVWNTFGPIVETTMAGRSQHFVDLPLPLAGRPDLPVGFFTFAHTPLRDETGEIAGFYCAATETTDAVLASRRAEAEHERLRQMFERAPGFTVMLEGPEHRYALANAAYRTLIGGRDPVGLTVREVLPELEGQGLLELLDRVYRTSEPFRGASRRIWLARGEGQPPEERVLDFIYQPVTDLKGHVTGIFVQGSDVTESHQASERLRQSEARFRAVFENAGVGVARVPLDGERWIEVNEALCRMLGYSRDDLLATRLSDILHPDDRGLECPSFLCKAPRCSDPYRIEGRFLHRNGGYIWVQQTVSLVRDAAGHPDFQIAIIEDMSVRKNAEEERQRSEAEARRLALTDSLTGLPNRAAFQRKLEQAVAEGGAITLILLDADHLKRANDHDGHAAGDILLRSLSARLRAVEHPNAFAARVGGDEFALLIGARVEDHRLDAVLGELCRPFQPAGLTLPYSASAGVAYPSASGSTAAQLMQKADLALYEAKAKGRATWQVFDHDLRTREQSKVAAIALLRRALDQQGVAPYYQPKVDLTTGRILGFEALLRIRRPDGAVHTAGTVSQALREPDLAAEADRTILRRVLLDLQRWQARGIALPVAVNLAERTIRRQGFAKDVLNLLNSFGVPTSLLEVEITETVLLDGGDDIARENLAALSEAGIRVALDDFGTGYASLSHLREYPVDQIKIDQQFVRASLSSPDDQAIISAIVGLGKSLSVQVVAEGIETEAQRRLLIAAGCEFGQGFFFSEALPADAVSALLAPASNPSTRHGRARGKPLELRQA